MRVGIFSDSHGDRNALDALLEKMGHIDAACFLGDIASDAAYLREKLAEMPHQPILYAVRGNNDLASMLPLTHWLEFVLTLRQYPELRLKPFLSYFSLSTSPPLN